MLIVLLESSAEGLVDDSHYLKREDFLSEHNQSDDAQRDWETAYRLDLSNPLQDNYRFIGVVAIAGEKGRGWSRTNISRRITSRLCSIGSILPVE